MPSKAVEQAEALLEGIKILAPGNSAELMGLLIFDGPELQNNPEARVRLRDLGWVYSSQGHWVFYPNRKAVVEDNQKADDMFLGAGPAYGIPFDREEQTDFEVVLVTTGPQRLGVIKLLREEFGHGLQDAKYIADNAPKTLSPCESKYLAERLKERFEAIGATIQIR